MDLAKIEVNVRLFAAAGRTLAAEKEYGLPVVFREKYMGHLPCSQELVFVNEELTPEAYEVMDKRRVPVAVNRPMTPIRPADQQPR
jgi:hypothetical protein